MHSLDVLPLQVRVQYPSRQSGSNSPRPPPSDPRQIGAPCVHGRRAFPRSFWAVSDFLCIDKLLGRQSGSYAYQVLQLRLEEAWKEPDVTLCFWVRIRGAQVVGAGAVSISVHSASLPLVYSATLHRLGSPLLSSQASTTRPAPSNDDISHASVNLHTYLGKQHRQPYLPLITSSPLSCSPHPSR